MGVLSTGGDAESFVNLPVNRSASIIGRVSSAAKNPYRKAVVSEQERMSAREAEKLIKQVARKARAQEVDTPTARDAALYRDVQAAAGTARRKRALAYQTRESGFGFFSGGGRVNEVEQEVLIKAAAGMRADEIAARKVQLLKEGAAIKKTGRGISQAAKNVWSEKDKVAFEAGRAGAIAMRHQQVDFSQAQDNLRQMFGSGDKIWGVNMQPVQINNDLNSGRSDPWDETSSMFGWGGQRERSGLF